MASVRLGIDLVLFKQPSILDPNIDPGPMIWSPLSELPSVGRSPTYIFTLVVFVFIQFGVIYAKNFGMMLAFRFLTGFVGSPALATGGASMVDMWSPRVSDYMIAIWAACSVAAPVLGPVVGGFAFSAEDWTWTMWELMGVSGFILVLLFFFLPETYGPNILARRARRVRRITGDTNYLTQAEIALQKVTINVGDITILEAHSKSQCTDNRHRKLCLKLPFVHSSSAFENPSFWSSTYIRLSSTAFSTSGSKHSQSSSARSTASTRVKSAFHSSESSS